MKTRGILDDSVIYLAGAMEAHTSGGSCYRTTFKHKCKTAGLKIKFLDPTQKITKLTPDVDKEKARIEEYRTANNWDALRSLMKKIVKQDLRQVDLSDLVIAFIDKKVFTCGTIQEIITAENQRKLVLVVAEGGKQNCPAWLFGIIHYNFIFDSQEEVVDYLVKVNNGLIPIDEKLVLFRKELKKLQA